MNNAQAKTREQRQRKAGKRQDVDPRKARTRDLIQVGGLAEIAGVMDCEPGALLGFFLQAKIMLEDKSTYENLKILGNSVLKERALSRQAKRKAKRTVR